MFDSLLYDLNNKITLAGGTQTSLPSYFREHYSIKKDAVIHSMLWDVPGFRRWRVTRMDAGEKLQVLNTVAYPEFENDIPIMGVDLLWFGVKKKLVAVLDFQPLIQDENYFQMYFKELKLLKSNVSSFANENNMHSYEIDKYFSPWVIFCRGGLIHMQDLLPSVFNQFISSYLDLYYRSTNIKSKIKKNEVRELHLSYDLYNSERDPAHGLFNSYFGKEWTNRFLNEFLFPYK